MKTILVLICALVIALLAACNKQTVTNAAFVTKKYAVNMYIPQGFRKYKSDTTYGVYAKAGSYFKYVADSNVQLIVWLGLNSPYKTDGDKIDVDPTDLSGLKMMDSTASAVSQVINGKRWVFSRYKLSRIGYKNYELKTRCAGNEIMVIFHCLNQRPNDNEYYLRLRDSIYRSLIIKPAPASM
jgi:hypothetical protein